MPNTQLTTSHSQPIYVPGKYSVSESVSLRPASLFILLSLFIVTTLLYSSPLFVNSVRILWYIHYIIAPISYGPSAPLLPPARSERSLPPRKLRPPFNRIASFMVWILREPTSAFPFDSNAFSSSLGTVIDALVISGT